MIKNIDKKILRYIINTAKKACPKITESKEEWRQMLLNKSKIKMLRLLLHFSPKSKTWTATQKVFPKLSVASHCFPAEFDGWLIDINDFVEQNVSRL